MMVCSRIKKPRSWSTGSCRLRGLEVLPDLTLEALFVRLLLLVLFPQFLGERILLLCDDVLLCKEGRFGGAIVSTCLHGAYCKSPGKRRLFGVVAVLPKLPE